MINLYKEKLYKKRYPYSKDIPFDVNTASIHSYIEYLLKYLFKKIKN